MAMQHICAENENENENINKYAAQWQCSASDCEIESQTNLAFNSLM
jgi:hypothetical protein